MTEDSIPNPVPAWMDSRFGPMTSHPAPHRSPGHGRRPEGGRRPPERHFPGFDPVSLPRDVEDDDPPLTEAAPADYAPPSEPPPAPAPELPVEQIVQEAIALALQKAAAGEWTVDSLMAERKRLIAFRPGVDEAMRELKQTKPDYWRERRAWLLTVRTQVHNRLHILNRQIGALQRAAFSAQTGTEAAAAAAEPAAETPPADPS